MLLYKQISTYHPRDSNAFPYTLAHTNALSTRRHAFNPGTLSLPQGKGGQSGKGNNATQLSWSTQSHLRKATTKGLSYLTFYCCNQQLYVKLEMRRLAKVGRIPGKKKSGKGSFSTSSKATEISSTRGLDAGCHVLTSAGGRQQLAVGRSLPGACLEAAGWSPSPPGNSGPHAPPPYPPAFS